MKHRARIMAYFTALMCLLAFGQVAVFRMSDSRMNTKLDTILETSSNSLAIQKNVESFLTTSGLSERTIGKMQSELQNDRSQSKSR